MVVRYTPYAMVGSVFIGVASLVWASDPSRPSILLAADSDKMLSLKASAAISGEPELAGLNLTIDVLNRVAVVGGEVPDESYVPKIRAILKKVPGLSEVKVSGWVPAASDPLNDRVGELLRGEGKPEAKPTAPKSNLPSLIVQPHPEQIPQRPLIPPLLAVPTPSETPAPAAKPAPAPTPTPTRSNKPSDALPPQARAEERTQSTVTVQRFSPMPNGHLLLEPVAPHGPEAAPRSTLETTIETLRNSDDRFTGLTVELRQRVAVIGGRATWHEDVWAFATQLRKVAGVEKVIVGNVDAR